MYKRQIQYQLITLMTCNGQAPFVTVFMYLDEVPEGRTRDDLAMIIEEVMKQRMQGVKNEKGVWITPAFPKLIYVLDEDNITEDSKYWYLTEPVSYTHLDVYKRQVWFRTFRKIRSAASCSDQM